MKTLKDLKQTSVIVTEKGMGGDSDFEGIINDFAKISMMAAFSNPIVGIGLLACASLAGGIIGAKALKNIKKNGNGPISAFKKWWNDGEEDSDSKNSKSKTSDDNDNNDTSNDNDTKQIDEKQGITDILSVVAGNLKESSKEDFDNFSLFLGSISNEDGELDDEKFETIMSDEDFVNELSNISADKETAESLHKAVSEMNDDTRSAFKGFLKDAHVHAAAKAEHDSLDKEIKELEKKEDLSSDDKKSIEEKKKSLEEAKKKMDEASSTMNNSYDSYHDKVKDNEAFKNAVSQMSKSAESSAEKKDDPKKEDEPKKNIDPETGEDLDDEGHEEADPNNSGKKRIVKRWTGPRGGKWMRVKGADGKWGEARHDNNKNEERKHRLTTLKEMLKTN